MNKSGQHGLKNSLTWSGVPMVLDQWFNQTLGVSYFMEIVLVSFGGVKVNRIRDYVVDILLGCIWYYFVTNKWKVENKC